MSRPACVVLLVVLWGGLYLLIHHTSGSAAPLRQPERQGLQAQFGGMYRRMLGDNPATLDPTFLTDAYGRAVVSQIFDGLVQLDAGLNPIPAIAEFWEASQDGRTWTFTLRQGVRFHHGREVTAQDFVYSFSRCLKPQKSVPLTEFFRRVQGAQDFMQGKTQHVEGLKALDRYTLQIALEESDSLVICVTRVFSHISLIFKRIVNIPRGQAGYVGTGDLDSKYRSSAA